MLLTICKEIEIVKNFVKKKRAERKVNMYACIYAHMYICECVCKVSLNSK